LLDNTSVTSARIQNYRRHFCDWRSFPDRADMAWLACGYSRIVVAIPVRDEAARIGPRLIALNKQMRPPDSVVLMLNKCTDEAETITRTMIPKLRFHLDVISQDLPLHQADTGHARALAMDAAAERAGPSGVLLTTDADAIGPPDWVVRNLRALHRGADIVCGRAIIDPMEAAVIPAHLHADDALECQLIALLDDLAWILDPEPHDPPPRHTERPAPVLPLRLPPSTGSVASWPSRRAKTGRSCGHYGLPTGLGFDATIDELRRLSVTNKENGTRRDCQQLRFRSGSEGDV
jgi:hypothetical protein